MFALPRLLAWWWVVGLAATLPSSVRAEEGDAAASDEDASSAASAEAALQRGREALALFEEGSHAAALALFEAAEASFHSPVFVVYIARCQRELGRLLEARSTFDRVLGEALPEDAAPPWLKAQADAAVEREALAARIPTLTVLVDAPTKEVTLTIDGRAVAVGAAIELNPGPRTVRASHRSRSVSQRLTVLASSHETLRLTLGAPAPTDPSPAPPGVLELPPPESAPPAGTTGLTTAGYVLSGLAVAALGAGTITGVMALLANEAAGEGCTDGGVCDAANRRHEDRAFTLAHASTTTFVVGGVAAGLAIVFVVVGGRSASVGGVSASPRGLELRF